MLLCNLFGYCAIKVPFIRWEVFFFSCFYFNAMFLTYFYMLNFIYLGFIFTLLFEVLLKKYCEFLVFDI